MAAGQKAEGLVLSPSSAGPPDHLPRSVRSTAKGGRGDVSSSLASEAGALRDGGESPSGESGSTHVLDSDATGSDSGSPESSRAKNEFGKPPGPLSDADLAAFFAAYNGSPIGVDSQLSRLSQLSRPWHRPLVCAGYSSDQHRGDGRGYTKPMEWLIPLRDPVPPLGDWRDDLVDESNVRDLIEPAPWEVLASPLDPLTFKSRGWSGT
ncbi:hypothetical protein F442_22839 [Phytophthora nicotianae P10297]|uniref:Uncharacterized protein n=1 Tax=Phytophthora nicotianae P10297 TaxID=1317064 RepID=W2XYV1_PHYNI|nr:hypothetical protein F442_22839 [Phytophthora nicotianae P10297]